MVTVGNLAKTYHMLPSEVIDRATTYDIMIADVMMTWENHKNNPNDPALYNEQDLINIVQRTKS